MYSAFYVQPIKIHYRLLETWHKPYFIGSRLRGMFGHALNALCCNQAQKNGPCTHFSTCAYHQVFIAKTVNKQQQPTPYVIQAPELGNRKMEAGETISFTVLLFNQAICFMPKILEAWANAQFEKTASSIEFIKAEIMDQNCAIKNTWHKGEPFPLSSPLIVDQRTPSTELCLQILTPMQLRKEGRVIRIQNLQAEDIIFATLRRFKSLVPNWQELYPNLILPPEIILAWAKSIEIKHSLNWVNLKRWSNSQYQEIPLNGMVGQICLRGNLEPFMAALQLLPYMGLGKSCNLGLGQIQLKGELDGN